MFTNEPIIKMSDGRLNYENERRITEKWFEYCGFKYEKVTFGRSEGFYFVNNGKKNRKVYLCCTRDLGKKPIGHFWFGFSTTYIRGNADTGLVLIMVWEDGTREYLIVDNKEVLTWRNLWYEKNGYYSIDVNVESGKYLMRGSKNYNSDFRFALNNILLIFD